MTSLLELVDNSQTDKNTVHSYLGLYEELLQSKKESAKNVLEIGIYNGGSIKLWHDYFPNATVHGADIMHIDQVWSEIKNKERIVLHTSSDAYAPDFLQKQFLDKGIKFDMMLDDGPHTLESMKVYVSTYSQLIDEDGILILEDVQDWAWIDILRECVPDNLKQYIETYDLRPNKNRYDDIVFVINKSRK